MTDPHDLGRELQQHATALRHLARDLVRDPHAAADVTQATLQQALSRRDLRPGPLGGFLRTVLQNCARQWHRRERRRRAHEGAQPRPEPAPSPADTLARRESLQRVTDAVLQLDEPYQSTILLRYFEDLPPRAIARRTRTSLATVKSRLQRGLALLRARLGQAGGDDWHLALATTFGWPRLAAGSGTAAAGAWLMGTTTKVLFAAGVLCIGGLLWVDFGTAPIRPLRSDTAFAAPMPPTAASAPHDVRDTGVQREEVADLASFDPWLVHPYTFELTVQCVDANGLPQAGCTVVLGAQHMCCSLAAETTGPDGCITVSLPARTPRGTVLLRDASDILRRVAVEHGRPRRFVLCFPEGNAPLVHRIALVGYLFRNASGASSSPTPMLAPGLHPFARFVEAAAGPVTMAETEVLLPLATVTFRPSAYQAARAFLSPQTNPTTASTTDGEPVLDGLVLDENGAPASAVVVALLGASPQPLQTTVTDADGRFRLHGTAKGPCTLRAGGGPEGLATVLVDVGADMPTATIQLRRNGFVRGSVETPKHDRLGNLRLTWAADDGSWADSTTTADGSFVFANLPPARGRICVWSPDAILPVATLGDVQVGQQDLLLQVDAGARSALRFAPIVPAACADSTVTARLWQLETGLGAELPQPEGGKPWCTPGLPAGWYRLELFAAGSGWTDRGTFWLDGTNDCDLGRIGMVEPGFAHFAPLDGASELCRLRGDFDVREQLAPAAFTQPLPLPPGDYALLQRRADGGLATSRFTVRSGATTDVTRD